MRIVALAIQISLAAALATPSRVAQSRSRWTPSSETAKSQSIPFLPSTPPPSINSLFHNKLFFQLQSTHTNSFIARSLPSSTALSAASASATEKPPRSSKTKTILATATLVLFDTQFRSLFVKYSIPFPSSLAGCGALFSGLLLLDAVSGETIGKNVFNFLNPGAALLAKWLPVFFVPSLITLPLANGLGNAWEVSRILLFIVIVKFGWISLVLCCHRTRVCDG